MLDVIAYPVPNVDWDAVQSELGTNEEDPEAIVHELAHAYDCIGKDAFQKPIGKQKDVAELILRKYRTKGLKYNSSEVRVTALTFLTLQPLGFTDLTAMLSSMHGNLGGTTLAQKPKAEVNQMFLDYLLDPRVQKDADKIRAFCMTFALP